MEAIVLLFISAINNILALSHHHSCSCLTDPAKKKERSIKREGDIKAKTQRRKGERCMMMVYCLWRASTRRGVGQHRQNTSNTKIN